MEHRVGTGWVGSPPCHVGLLQWAPCVCWGGGTSWGWVQGGHAGVFELVRQKEQGPGGWGICHSQKGCVAGVQRTQLSEADSALGSWDLPFINGHFLICKA